MNLSHNEVRKVSFFAVTALGVDFSDHTLLNNTYVEAAEEMLNVLISRFQNVLLYSQWLFNWSELKKKQDKLLKILHGMADMVSSLLRTNMTAILRTLLHTNFNYFRSFKQEKHKWKEILHLILSQIKIWVSLFLL